MPRQLLIGGRKHTDICLVPAAKRTFVIGVADAYHLGRELIDQEPNRSVQIRRRIDTRIPTPLLSVAVMPQSSHAKPTLGNLGTLRPTPTTATGVAPVPIPPTTAAWIRPTANTSIPRSTMLTPNSSHPSLTTLGRVQVQGEASGSGSGAGSGNVSMVNTPRHSRPVTPTPPVLEVKGKVGEVDEVDWDED